jgi:exopolysaccharide biosynthesis predicted pyruvyltransferase EpsI
MARNICSKQTLKVNPERFFKNKLIKGPDMVIHTCNPSCLETESERIMICSQPRQNVSKTYHNKQAECDGICL